MSQDLYAFNATVDKFIGDTVMAFWGDPIEQKDHAELSVIASFKIQQTIKKLELLFEKNGWPIARVGIGINTGEMHVGNMGSKHRVTYTVIGDNVNLASRLERLTRAYQAPIVVSEATAKKATGILFRELDTVTVKGKTIPTRIFQPICLHDQLTPPLIEQQEQHKNALQYYYEKKYQASAEIFSDMVKIYPADPYYEMMQQKTTRLSQDKALS